ncbi:GNAT family N-acetyltransferase [Halocatena halophila]|uniref:GNAT family N-acetyltransferase n=1 Tax=Halocatena halophila TaxID=2814576 RepID=UPI002ED61631
MFPETISTDRLSLEILTEDHLFELYEHASIDADHIEEITEYLNWSPHKTLNESREFIESACEERESGRGVTYVVYPRADQANAGEFGGLCGLTIDWRKRTGTLGIWLRKPLWGRGYSGERADALIAMAFDRLDLELVDVLHHVDNNASRSAIETYVERHGGRKEGMLRNYLVYDDGSVVDTIRYTISQKEFGKNNAQNV